MLPSMRGDSVESRRELERLRREKRAWQSERKQIRKHLEQIERACRHALPHVRGRVVLERDREQLRKYLEQIQRACRKARGIGRWWWW